MNRIHITHHQTTQERQRAAGSERDKRDRCPGSHDSTSDVLAGMGVHQRFHIGSDTQASSPDQLTRRLVEESEDLASNVLLLGLLVVHDAGRCGQDDEAVRA